MSRLPILTLVLAFHSYGLGAPAAVEIDDRGVVAFTDGQPLARAVLAMHAPQWRLASVESAGKTARDGDDVSGSIALPENCEGTLGYSVSLLPTETGADLRYTMAFSDANDIFGAHVSFLLPCARFEGRSATLLRTGSSAPLPAPGEALNLGGTATAFAVAMADGNSLVIASDAASAITVQDNRKYGGAEYEVRFRVFGRGRVTPSMAARRAFRVSVVPSTDVSRAVDDMSPQVSFDPNKPYALVGNKGQVTIGTRENSLVTVSLAIHGLGWAYTAQADADAHTSGDSKTRFIAGSMVVPAAEGQSMEFVQTASQGPDGALGLRYHITFPRAVRLNGYQVSFSIGLDDYAGAEIVLETPDGPLALAIPLKHEDNFLHSGPITAISVAPGRPEGFSIGLDQPSELLIQDGRGWGGSAIELRFNFRRQEEGALVPAGETIERQFAFKLNSPLQIILDESGATDETDTADWIPYTLPWDDAPVDLSFLNHRPAGKFGFVAVEDGKFVFSDTNEEVRFWGTCFSAGANFPTHEQSEKIARRLARFGVNMVRTHHADARWAERHFFKDDADNTREFDPENLDRFDYLLHCLKQEGIYIYLDQLVNRYFKPGDGVDEADKLGACGKPYSNFDPRLIELQKEFSANLWTHVNPYTGLAYRDDPAIALMEFANENDLFTQEVTLEPYRTRFERMYRDWAEAQGVSLPEGEINFRNRTDDLMRFLVEVQRNYYLEMARYLRDEIGVRVPMTGSNWSRNAALLASLRDMPFTDSHTYWNHPSGEGVFANTPMLGSSSTIFGPLAFQRVVGKPFFVSEWDEPWPNEWRAELICWMAAIAALQQWNGLTVYTYRHSSAVPVDHISGAFETFNDPARFGLFPHAALIFRRGDVARAEQKVAVLIPQELAVSARTPSPWGASAYAAFAETHRIDTALFDAPEGYDRVVDVLEQVDAPDDPRRADGGQISRSIAQKVGAIDSPSSQVIFGFLGDAGQLATANMTVNCDSLFAAIALSSLTDAPIGGSDRLLLTAVGRAENTGFIYNLLRNKRIATGSSPILIDPIRASIAIRTTERNLTVQAIGPDGNVLGPVPSKYEDGRLIFTIGPECGTMYYQIAPGP